MHNLRKIIVIKSKIKFIKSEEEMRARNRSKKWEQEVQGRNWSKKGEKILLIFIGNQLVSKLSLKLLKGLKFAFLLAELLRVKIINN